MDKIGLKELKSRLSEVVNRCRQGEIVIITDRGQEIAELRPLSEARRVANRMRRAGRVQWAGGKPQGLSGIKLRGGGPISDTVIENRR